MIVRAAKATHRWEKTMTAEETAGGVGDVRALLARIEASWSALMEILDDIPDDRQAEPGAVGEWSLKDVFGHIAFWDEVATEDAERVLAGQPNEHDDYQAMNDADYQRRRDRSLPEQRSAMHQAHAALVDYLDDIEGLDATALDAAIKGDTYEHYDEHVADIRAWRERAGV
jgi:hypothetical protein